MTSLQNQTAKGQGLLETLLILPVASAVITLLFFSGYRALVYFYADHVLHEAMICTDAESISVCEREFSRQIKLITLRNEQVSLDLSRSGMGKNQTIRGRVEVFSALKAKIKIEKQMRFPLKGIS